MISERNPASLAAGPATLAQHESSSSPSGFLARLCLTALRFDPALLAVAFVTCAGMMR
jgi:hypothetical protein